MYMFLVHLWKCDWDWDWLWAWKRGSEDDDGERQRSTGERRVRANHAMLNL
jgi:hypothetical protein